MKEGKLRNMAINEVRHYRAVTGMDTVTATGMAARIKEEAMTIAIDFDGTIVEHAYPEIGRPIPFAIETLLQLQEDGHRLILWTVRSGDLLQEAVNYCAERGLRFFAENENYRGEMEELSAGDYPRKLKADLFIDDRNLGGLPDWGVIYNAVKVTAAGGARYKPWPWAPRCPSPRKTALALVSAKRLEVRL